MQSLADQFAQDLLQALQSGSATTSSSAAGTTSSTTSGTGGSSTTTTSSSNSTTGSAATAAASSATPATSANTVPDPLQALASLVAQDLLQNLQPAIGTNSAAAIAATTQQVQSIG
jgi:hypothetical protein